VATVEPIALPAFSGGNELWRTPTSASRVEQLGILHACYPAAWVKQRIQEAHEYGKERGLALLTLYFNEVKSLTPLTVCLHVRNLVHHRYCPRWTHSTDTALAWGRPLERVS